MGAAVLSDLVAEVVIPVSAAVGIAFALVQWLLVSKVKLTPEHQAAAAAAESKNGSGDYLIEEEEGLNDHNVVVKCAEIQNAISEVCRNLHGGLCSPHLPFPRFGEASARKASPAHTARIKCASQPLQMPYLALSLSYLCNYLRGFWLPWYEDCDDYFGSQKRCGKAFIAAFRSGAVMAFACCEWAPCPVHCNQLIQAVYGDDWEGLFEAITVMALVVLQWRFSESRGVFILKLRCWADLVIADNVGDNVGDIAGMGSDLFGSYAESSCAALVVASISSFGVNHDLTGMLYPCLLALWIKAVKEIEPALKRQLIISTALMTVVLRLSVGSYSLRRNRFVGWFGHWLVTEYYTSNAYSPVQDVADSCRTGAATNVIFGLALGYKSVIIPIFAIAVSIFVSFSFAAMYGIAVAALGMLSTIATGLAIDAYGPISDNAGGIAEMAGMSHRIRERTDALDAAGNTTAAIGKGFAIGSAALVSLALFGAFVSRAAISTVDVLTPKVFIGLIVGAMLPYWFSAMTMKSVGTAALKMVEEVRRQFNTIPGLMEGTTKPDYATCVKISTDASIKEMIPPGALVMLTPLIVGTFFGVETLSGVLAGSLVSGVQIAISASNTGGAWDNAKKYIEAGASEHARTLGPKGSDAHKAAVIGDTIGDPLKDTSGPSLNILIKLMAVESLVFAPFFATHGGLLFKIF
ncbi:Pyrophosphate-energized vacuolar membrane proton pump [Ananas comosus]|uniref:H(+)-exporting diphosphatase n=1 Tax=Ananas comosus TaxID=4615 RepID=A0A199VNP5_ANACO|nr:Pyrophosphate-energized vacuolar membrane proton pump [Ananas comosus]